MSSNYYTFYALYSAIIIGTGQLINRIVPDAYMDELIHIPQAQAYCRGEWSTWDTRLTTPPGLYLISSLPTFLPFNLPNLCTPSSLRLVNTLFLLLLPLIYSSLLPLLNHPIHKSSTTGKSTPSKQLLLDQEREKERFEGIVISCWPVLNFFGYLYYTDAGSTVFILSSLWAGRERKWILSALTGAASLWFRQTNIIWLGLIAITSVITELQSISELYDPPLISARMIDVPHSIFSLLTQSLLNIFNLLPILLSYIPVFLSFAYFIHWNGGIVLGDKTNHIPTIHIPQIYYFLAFSVIFLAPTLINPKSITKSLLGLFGTFKRIVISTIVIIIMCYTIKEYTIVHPFLLSDNRHYAFYIYRRIINLFPTARYLLSIPYLICLRLIYDKLAKSTSLTLLPTLFYLFSLSTTLIPSPLIEPRYFIIPFLLLRLHLPTSSSTSSRVSSRNGLGLGIELIYYTIISLITLGIFLGITFDWNSGKEEERMGMRFMW